MTPPCSVGSRRGVGACSSKLEAVVGAAVGAIARGLGSGLGDSSARKK